MGGYHFTCAARLPWIVQAPPGEHSITPQLWQAVQSVIRSTDSRVIAVASFPSPINTGWMTRKRSWDSLRRLAGLRVPQD